MLNLRRGNKHDFIESLQVPLKVTLNKLYLISLCIYYRLSPYFENWKQKSSLQFGENQSFPLQIYAKFGSEKYKVEFLQAPESPFTLPHLHKYSFETNKVSEKGLPLLKKCRQYFHIKIDRHFEKRFDVYNDKINSRIEETLTHLFPAFHIEVLLQNLGPFFSYYLTCRHVFKLL